MRYVASFLLLAMFGCSTPPPAGRPVPIGTVAFTRTGGFATIPALVNGDSAMLMLALGMHGVVLDTTLARTRGLAAGKSGDPAGVVGTIRLPGDVELRDYLFWLGAYGRLSEASGGSLEGSVGDDFLGRLTIEVDFSAQVIRLYEPRAYTYRGSGVILPLDSTLFEPVVPAMIDVDGHGALAARLLLSSRSAHTCLLLNPSFVRRNDMVRRAAPTLRGPFLTSPSGAMQLAVGRLHTLALGPLSIDSPTVFMHEDTIDDGREDGVIGMSLLRDARLILDYTRHRAIIEPGQNFGHTCGFDRSGLVLKSHGPDYHRITVEYVVPGSPAADAGIHVGDQLVSLDEQGVASLDLETIRRALMTTGAVRDVGVVRKGDTVNVKLALRQLF